MGTRVFWAIVGSICLALNGSTIQYGFMHHNVWSILFASIGAFCFLVLAVLTALKADSR